MSHTSEKVEPDLINIFEQISLFNLSSATLAKSFFYSSVPSSSSSDGSYWATAIYFISFPASLPFSGVSSSTTDSLFGLFN